MDQERFDNAVVVRDAGHVEDAIREFHSMALQADDANEKAILLLNEVRCYTSLGRTADAEHLLKKIDELEADDAGIRLRVEYVWASVKALQGAHQSALAGYNRILQTYAQLLQTLDYRDLYEETQQRRAIALMHLGRHREAAPILVEANSFRMLPIEGQQETHLFLGLCYEELGDKRAARDEYQRATEFGLANETEAEARYRFGILCFLGGGTAQAKYQFEAILQASPEGFTSVPRKSVYRQLATICHHLGETEDEKRYLSLAGDR